MNLLAVVIKEMMPIDISKEPIILGVSLKMYFGHQETIDWCKRVSQIAMIHPAVSNGLVKLFVLPSMPTLGVVSPVLKSSNVGLGAQDLFHQDRGAYTGEVGGPMLRELGCQFVEIGHAERRKLFGETDHQVAEKLAAAVRNDLVPVLCVGEQNHVSPKAAADLCINQVKAATQFLEGKSVGVIVAYEPVWAIGAEEPASTAHIIEVCKLVSEYLDATKQFEGSRVIYGGSAGPGLITELGGKVSGLFLGRFAHDTKNLVQVLDEVSALFANRAA
jgi:triosephosphate isomerase